MALKPEDIARYNEAEQDVRQLEERLLQGDPSVSIAHVAAARNLLNAIALPMIFSDSMEAL